MFRVHIQNDAGNPLFAITAAQWRDAVTRAGENPADYAPSFGDTLAELRAAASAAEALIAPPGPLAASLPLVAPALQLIFCTTAGVDALAPFERLPRGVTLVCNRGIHGEKAGEYAIMAILMLAMHLPALIGAQGRSMWEPRYTSTLAGRRVTVLGLGTLGAAAAARARSFAMSVTGISLRGRDHPACQRTLPASKLDDVLPESEFLLLACPLTKLTRGILNDRRLSLLPPAAGVVNIGRGALIVEDALADLLVAGHLGGAVLDVFASEPLAPTHRFWRTPNLLVTPHISADDPTTYNQRTLDRFLTALAAVRRGEAPRNLVDRARGY
ncbi:MAG: D-2-hydroxyacid dehydrogenase [Acetobacteraceae bacterium]